MLIEDGVYLIGDPHFGKDFKTGVPLHRRGEREAMQAEQFMRELSVDCRMNIMVGDLFDVPLVPLSVVHSIADMYEEVSTKWPERLWVLIAGNHDLDRQIRNPKTGKLIKGSFHALARMLHHLPNVRVLFEPEVIEGVALFPWQWGITAVDQVRRFDTLPAIAVGHWDLIDFGGTVDHMCPTALLRNKGVEQIYSGHIHNKGMYLVEEQPVICTGSMQPYAHDQDPEGNLYVTLSLEELELANHDELRHKNVRLVLNQGETLPDLDCLSLTVKRNKSVEDIVLEEISLQGVDIQTIVEQQMEELNVPPAVQTYIREKISAFN